MSNRQMKLNCCKVFDRFEPVDYGCGVFPLVEVVFFRDCAVDAVEDVFADFAYLGLRGVDESAGRLGL